MSKSPTDVLHETFGAQVYASPTNLTSSGRAILEKDPDCTGSLGIAISEAVEDAATHVIPIMPWEVF